MTIEPAPPPVDADGAPATPLPQAQAMNAVRTATSALNTIARDRKNATPKTWAIGCGALLLLCMVCWACSAALQATGIIKPPPTPTATAIPTDTAVPPTEEPRPTPTEAPTEDPTAEASRKAVDGYVDWASEQFTGIGEAAGTLGERFGELGEDPTVLLDKDWRLQTGVMLGVLKVYAQELQQREDVPPEAADIHARITGVAAKLDRAATLYAQGLDNVDANTLGQAVQLIGEVGTEMDSIRPEFLALKNDR